MGRPQDVVAGPSNKKHVARRAPALRGPCSRNQGRLPPLVSPPALPTATFPVDLTRHTTEMPRQLRGRTAGELSRARVGNCFPGSTARPPRADCGSLLPLWGGSLLPTTIDPPIRAQRPPVRVSMTSHALPPPAAGRGPPTAGASSRTPGPWATATIPWPYGRRIVASWFDRRCHGLPMFLVSVRGGRWGEVVGKGPVAGGANVEPVVGGDGILLEGGDRRDCLRKVADRGSRAYVRKTLASQVLMVLRVSGSGWPVSGGERRTVGRAVAARSIG